VVACRERLEQFVLRRDLRDISRIWALDPDGQAYVQVPFRTLSRPPISVCEQRAATAGCASRAQPNSAAVHELHR
jgi:putative transposase